MRYSFYAYMLATVLLVGCATPVQQAKLSAAREIPTGTDAKPIQFKKVLVKLRRGEKIGTSYVGLACIPQGDVEWKGGRVNITDDEFTEAFREELQKYNYPVVGDPNALFEDPSSWKAELLVAGQITKLELSACYPMAGFGNFKDSKGGAFVRVSWQIYGQLERKVVHELVTEGSFQTESMSAYGIEKNLTNAFAMAVQNLLADEKFHALVLRKNAGPSAAVSGGAATQTQAGQAPQVTDVRYTTNAPSSLERARGATVTVFAGGGHGSGFVISQDGVILTSEHVVKEARFVTVRLSDGKEQVADVLRRDTARDVALIKLRNASGLTPAVLALGSQPQIGVDVFSIGTPRRESLDLTVSKGIVSAYREDQGQRFIQSDVQIHPGNSGGPLVLSDGRVVGIAAQGLMLRGASQNLNFFVPIDEAVRAVGVGGG